MRALRRYARHIDDLPHIPAAAGVLRHRLVVAHFLHAFHSRVLHWLGVVHQIPKRQVRVFHDRAGLVKDLHCVTSMGVTYLPIRE